jgi:hypothetical protein
MQISVRRFFNAMHMTLSFHFASIILGQTPPQVKTSSKQELDSLTSTFRVLRWRLGMRGRHRWRNGSIRRHSRFSSNRHRRRQQMPILIFRINISMPSWNGLGRRQRGLLKSFCPKLAGRRYRTTAWSVDRISSSAFVAINLADDGRASNSCLLL